MHNLKKIIIPVLFLIQILVPELLTAYNWEPYKVDNDAWINDITYHNGSFFACHKGIFKSTDVGGTWSISTQIKVNDSFFDGYGRYDFYRMISSEKTILASIQSGGYVLSVDEGLTWIYNEGKNLGAIKSFCYLDSVLYAGSDAGLFKSTDFGYNWESISNELNINGLEFNELKLSPDSNMFACAFGKILKLDRKTDKWDIINVIYSINLSVNSISFIDSSLIIGTNDGVFFSNNNGMTWENIFNDPQNNTVVSVEAEDQRIFVGTRFNGVFETYDTGKTWFHWWKYENQPISAFKRIGQSPLILIGNGVTFEMEYDRFYPFSRYGCGYPIINSIFFNIYDQLIYLTSANLYFSHPQKSSLMNSITHLLPSKYRILFVNDNNSNTLFYCDTNNILYSCEGVPFTTGLSYTSNKWIISDSMMNNIKDLKSDASGNLFGLNISGDLFKSKTNGKTWSKIPDIDSVLSICVDNKKNIILAVQDNTYLISFDRGESWLNYPNDFNNFYSDTINYNLLFNNKIISAGNKGIYSSNDFGKSWLKADGLPISRYFKLLCVGSELFVTSDSGVYRSLDSGMSWFDYSDGLPDRLRQCKEIAVDRNGFLYIGTDYYGMYKSIDSVTSISENVIDNKSLDVYPNPASDFIEISVGANGRSPLQSEIRFLNIFGQTVLSIGAIHELPVRIDVSGLAPGMYFVRIGDKVIKFIKI
jgi:photosystem II stability/assembly factor-like uncharacterized protein